MTHPLRILHISDLHERVALDWMDAERRAKVRAHAASRHRVLEGSFFQVLDEIRSAGAIDLVCFTGDVADFGLQEEYQQATRRIESILQAAGVSRERLYLVPGNHDVRRAVVKAAWRKMRELGAANQAGLSSWMAGESPPFGARPRWRDEIQRRTAEFWRWVAEDLDRKNLHPSHSPHGRLGYRVEVAGLGLPFPVCVIGLDSAWLCGDENDTGKLLLTSGQVDLLTSDQAGRPLPGFRLALAHHPLTALAEADGATARRLLATTVDLLLHGHQHDPIAEETSDPDRAFRTVAAGSLYEGERWPNSFHLVEVLLADDGRPLRYDLEFWGWSERGHWYRTGALYRAAPEGRLQWWTPDGKTWWAEEQARQRAEAFERAIQAQRVFVGRQQEMAQLKGALLAGEEPAQPCAISAVQGMPGVGKSFLADEFARQHGGNFPGGILRLAPGEGYDWSAEALRQDLCDQLDLRPRWDLLWQRLLVPACLLILENVDGPVQAAAVAAFVRRLPGARIVVTGRYQQLGVSAGWRQVLVRPFSPQDALEQLSLEFRPASDAAEEKEFRRLVTALGCLPLAIHIAAGHLRLPGQTCHGFLHRLRGCGLTLGPADPVDHLTAERAKGIIATTFDLSLDILGTVLGPEGERLLAGLACLGYGLPGGFGRSLGTAMAGLDDEAFERLAVEACRLSLLEYESRPQRPGELYRLHPLLAELLRGRTDPVPVMARMTGWFIERLADESRWNEVHGEVAALAGWLRQVPEADLRRVERAGSRFAIHCGPFHDWLALCERGLASSTDDAERSDYLWTLGQVALGTGQLDRAWVAAQEKLAVDRQRGAEREVALAEGQIADILQARGELDEALRIRREEELPVYERLGDVRERAVTMGQIADILQARGELDEALRIRREEALPVYERLGDVRELLVGRANLALSLIQRGGQEDRREARRLLELALASARKLRIPESQQIEEILRRLDWGR